MNGLPRTQTARYLISGILLTALSILSFMVLRGFLLSVVWAVVIAYVLWPPYQWLRQQLGGKASLSAALMTGLIAMAVLLIVFGLASLLQDETQVAYQAVLTSLSQESIPLPDFISRIPGLGPYLQSGLEDFNHNRAEVVRQFAGWSKQWLGGIAAVLGNFGHNVMKLGVVFVTVFFCFRDGNNIIAQIQQGVVRFLGEHQQAYLLAAGSTVRAVVYGLVLAALGQGLLAGMGYAVAGVQAPVLFGAMTALLALVPMGATLVWLPLGLSLLWMGQFWQGVGLLLWGFFAVSTVDNVIRPLVISGAGQIPFLVVLFGVLGGLSAFGAVGLFLGPVILAVLLSVWQAWLQQQPQAETAPDATPPPTLWHTLSAAVVVQVLGSDTVRGLAAATVAERTQHYGANRLNEKPPRPLWLLFAAQFQSGLIAVLVGAAVLAATVGDIQDGVVILAVVVINAALGFYQEYQAEKSLSSLTNMLALQAQVRRDGRTVVLPADQLVPGDIVVLEAGGKIPADGRILEAYGLEVDESSLTGESLPVAKHAQPLDNAAQPLAERSNMLYMNNAVTHGRGLMIVTATGMATEIGKLADLLAQTEDSATPLQIQLDSLGKHLVLIALAVIALIFAFALWRGEPLIQTALTAIALAVAAIPEGLPAVVTVTLALGMHRMARQQAIVKRLAAVETLGCTTVICTDKTGTLTVNQMTARELFYQGQAYTVSGEGYSVEGTILPSAPSGHWAALVAPLVLCNDSYWQGQQLIGEPMEKALRVLAAKSGAELGTLSQQWPRLAEIPFDAGHKFMATFHRHDDQIIVFVKGAPEVLLARCANANEADGLAANTRMAGSGLRVLGFASRVLPDDAWRPEADLFSLIQDLTFVALVGLMDPPRAEAKAAIKLCQQAGIAVKMITGDQKITAMAIAQELGLSGLALDGEALAEMDDDALAACINDISVFARTVPAQKVRIVNALKAYGHVVAMTGDGVNDAPALKSADIGIAMGNSGTDVARDAATLILTDDNFASIVTAVKEGRGIYDNMVKFIRFQLSTNMGAIIAVAVAPMLGMPVPFSAIQLLWINIIMDGPPAMSLGVDPVRAGCMNEAPRPPQARILSLQRFGNLLSYGLTMAVGTLGVFYYALHTGDVLHATSLAFTTFVLFQVGNIFNARAEKTTAFNAYFLTNPMLWLALAAIVLLQITVVHWPVAQELFHTTALSLTDWGLASAVAASVLVLEELRKRLQPLFFHD